MSTNVKCIWLFETSAGYGWTETHYLTFSGTGTPDLAGVLATMDKICTTRRSILALSCSIVGIRASFATPGGIASANDILNFPGTAFGNLDSKSDSLAVQMQDATFTRKKIIHIRGFPVAVIQGDVYSPLAVQGFDKAMTAYISALKNAGFGWVGKDPANSVFGAVTGYTADVANQITFTCQPSPVSQALSTLVGGTKPLTYECRFSKINHSSSVLNRTFVVTPSQTGTPPAVTGLTTVATVSAGPFLAAGRFNISIPQFIGYSSGGPISAGERRMGKPLSHYPGRGRRRPVI